MTWETVKTDSEEHREKQVTPDKDAASPGRAGGGRSSTLTAAVATSFRCLSPCASHLSIVLL